MHGSRRRRHRVTIPARCTFTAMMLIRRKCVVRSLPVHWHKAHVGKHVLLINMFDAQNVRVFFNSTACFFFRSRRRLRSHCIRSLYTLHIIIIYTYTQCAHVARCCLGLFSRLSSCICRTVSCSFGRSFSFAKLLFIHTWFIRAHLTLQFPQCARSNPNTYTHIRERTLDS